MTDHQNHAAGDAQPTPLQIFVQRMRNELGDPELVKQALADFNASQLQDARNNFEARLEYGKQIAEQRQNAYRGLTEYGLQTLKWLFLLNAGAIVVLLGYLGASAKTGVTAAASAALFKALWPFAIGCVCVGLAGAASFFNFSYAEASTPSSETLHNFLQPGAGAWPIARFQRQDESREEFYRRFAYKVTWSRNAAIGLTVISSLFFIYGVYLVFRAVAVP